MILSSFIAPRKSKKHAQPASYDDSTDGTNYKTKSRFRVPIFLFSYIDDRSKTKLFLFFVLIFQSKEAGTRADPHIS